MDETLRIVILVGIQKAKDCLAQVNQQYSDRCNYFCEFQPANRKDIELVANEVLEVEIPNRLIETIHFNYNINFRKAMRLMYTLENRIKQNPRFLRDNALMEMEL